MNDLQAELLKVSKTTGKPVAECLAELITACLSSDESHPLHVYSFDLIKQLDGLLK